MHAGQMEGAVLETLPSTLIDWKTWRTRHPETTVLAMSRTAREFVKAFQEDSSRFVLGLRSSENEAKAYSFKELKATPVVHDTFAGDPVLLVYDHNATGGRAFIRRVGKDTLTFKRSAKGVLIDAKTNSEWDTLGRCVQGKLQGRQLTEIPAIVSFRTAWYAFYPKSLTYKPSR